MFKLHSGFMCSCHLTNKPYSLGLSPEHKQREITSFQCNHSYFVHLHVQCRLSSKAKWNAKTNAIEKLETREFYFHNTKKADSSYGQSSHITSLWGGTDWIVQFRIPHDQWMKAMTTQCHMHYNIFLRSRLTLCKCVVSAFIHRSWRIRNWTTGCSAKR